MAADTIRASLYRFVQKHLVGPLPRSAAEGRSLVFRSGAPERAPGTRRAWFHGASVGELESLRTVVEQALRSGWEIVLTHFSPSAAGAVARFQAEHRSPHGGKIVYAGYSPWEGSWGDALELYAPDVFVTAKYEAWPDLWWELAERRIPLLIVGPKARSSLRLVERLTRICGRELPRLALALFEEGDRAPLETVFPRASFRAVSDPRWDRVRERALRPHPRVERLRETFSRLPRPWIVLGSAWEEDLDRLAPAIAEPAEKNGEATWWIVPHKTDDAHVEPMLRKLSSLGVKAVRTRGLAEAHGEAPPATLDPRPRAIIVDEMGFLSELYAIADVAYVGGGFGAGVHSTIEPAVHGLRIVCGPKNAGKFAEISQLEAAGQLTLARSGEQALEAVRALRERARAGTARFEAPGRFGGTSGVWEIMEEIVSRPDAW